MKNVLVLYGEEQFLIDKAISDVQAKHPTSQMIKYDLLETNISFLLEDASMMSLFNDDKIIVGYNADFLSGAIKKETINHNIDSLDNYISHPNPNTILILTVLNDKLDKRKTIVKKIMNVADVREFPKQTTNELTDTAKNTFNKAGYKITFKALNDLISKTGNNLYLLNSECEKLMIYKLNDKNITEEDIEEMVDKYDFDNIFALTDAVVKKDINTSLHLYQELLKRNEEPIKIIVLLANQFRLIFQVKRLYAKGFSEGQIASDLGIHPYRVKLANEVKISEKDVLNYLSLLADLDEEIKTGKTNKDVGLELFLLKL